MKAQRATYFVLCGLAAGWLAVATAWVSLTIGAAQSDGRLRYPGAVRWAEPKLRWQIAPSGRVDQQRVYHTADSWTKVLSWYARRLGLDLDRRPRLADDCFQFDWSETRMAIRQSGRATLCADGTGTWVFMDSSLSWTP